MNTNFSTLSLKPELTKNIKSLGYQQMTPIQAQSLPAILAGKDVIAQGKTGSGKTAAFGIGLLNKLVEKNYNIQSLVVCPTRELAEQVAKALRDLARTLQNVKVLTLCGGVSMRPQTISLEHRAHIIVGTPGRIVKHLDLGNLHLNQLTTLVLDEGDRMLEMGFQEDLDVIIGDCPEKRQTLLFSATYPDKIREIADSVMSEPIMVKVDTKHDHESIKQHFYKVGNVDERQKAIRLLLQAHQPESTVIFCNTKRDAIDVTDMLIDEGFSALDIHGDLEQRDRDETLIRFVHGSISILVATDVAARGLDIESLDMVINYHTSPNPEVHTHRVGRTGRAGSKGMACSLFGDRETNKIALIEEFIGTEIVPEQLPDDAVLDNPKVQPKMVTLNLSVGKKQKMRPGSLLGLMTGDNGLKGDQIGKINIFPTWSFIAVTEDAVDAAFRKLDSETWKGRPIKSRILD